MAEKSYKVYFARTSMGQQGGSIAQALREAYEQFGPNLPPIELGGEGYQVRNLERTGRVWKGVFGRLRDDAPHIVDAVRDQEREIDLQEGDRIIDKCHFLYRERRNVLVWQTNRTAGGLSRAQQYLAQVLDDYVELPQIMNEAELAEVLEREVYEVSFSYDRPPSLGQSSPAWTQHAFDMMENVHAAQAKFVLRAQRGSGLTGAANRMVRRLVGEVGVEKVRVRLTDDSEPVELFMAPLKTTIKVSVIGRYPIPAEVYQALEQAYDNHRDYVGAPEPGE
ncbi:DUF6731 family protein [Piscinibacter koreensis]|uniref:Uncharacterized protein n=1 Tax=Piscinibacter koreensis TaxID=2742824 RepID=A0A7Y6NQX0_9BURK|nr:DUF6731 family protein [Schlegelella koreensis]NUZ07659.1 hypothetical protein [Schlegelella koreensis]